MCSQDYRRLALAYDLLPHAPADDPDRRTPKPQADTAPDTADMPEAQQPAG